MKDKLEQIQEDISLCKQKIIEAMNNDVYSVIPIYTEIILTLIKENDSAGKNVFNATIHNYNKGFIVCNLDWLKKNTQEGMYSVDCNFYLFINTAFWKQTLKEYPKSFVTAQNNSVLVTIER